MSNATDPKYRDGTAERSEMEEAAYADAARIYALADDDALVSAYIAAGLAHLPYYERVMVSAGREASTKAWGEDGFREAFFTTRDESRALTRIISERDPALVRTAEKARKRAIAREKREGGQA